MAKQIKLEANKTYKTEANAIKAVEKVIINPALANLRYFIMTDDAGRFFPVFIGMAAVQAGVHFHFNVVA